MKCYRIEYLDSKYFVAIKNIQYTREQDDTVYIMTGYGSLIIVDKKSWNKKEVVILDAGYDE